MQYKEIKVGETRTYHEGGNRGKVLILAIDHNKKVNGESFTAITFRALEELSGSSMFVSIPKGDEWESETTNGEGSGYSGWYVE
jgi:hypothetical protein